MRLFIGIPLTETARRDIAAAIAKTAPLPGRPVAPRNWHITLAFLGETSQERKTQVTGELQAASRVSPFDVTFSGAGTFPNADGAKTLWMKVTDGIEPLRSLQADVARICLAAGFKLEDREFRPHLTLARLKAATPLTDFVAGFPPTEVPLRVERFVLYKSQLAPGGSEYFELEQFEL